MAKSVGNECFHGVNGGLPNRAARLCAAVALAALALAPLAAAGNGPRPVSRGVWWWRGADASSPAEAARRIEFLSRHGVTEIYFCSNLKDAEGVRGFVRAAGAAGMRVALLAGDVSWIHPGNRGFAETLKAYLEYQQSAAPGERFYALHFDVEPHQDPNLSEARKWQLYADFVLRAAAAIHAAGEKVEWDIPFWLDDIEVAYGYREKAPLLEVVMDNSDGVALMSYRDTAESILDISKTELEMAKGRKTRIVLGAETGKTDEPEYVTFFEEGAAELDAELAKVMAALEAANVHGGAGVAVHHLGSWEKLVSMAGGKEVKQ